jgi:hypothetical protein
MLRPLVGASVSDRLFHRWSASQMTRQRSAPYSNVTIRVARDLVRLAEPLLIMAALFAAPIIAKEISRGRAITD